MKLGKDVLSAIVLIIQKGLSTGSDVSDDLRAIDVVPAESEGIVVLSDDYRDSQKGA